MSKFPPRILILLFLLVLVSCNKETMRIGENPESADPKAIPADTVTNRKEVDPSISWVFEMQAPSGLLESAENTNVVSLYDNALAAIFFIHLGERAKAEAILDYFHQQRETELLSGSGGFYQLRTVNGEEKRNRWLGDNAWLLMAFRYYEEQYQNEKYRATAADITAWIRALQDTDGGLKGGIRENGNDYPKVTEGIITAFMAVNGFDQMHCNILSFLKAQRFDPIDNVLLSWPENPAYAYALDVHTLGAAIFPDLESSLLSKTERFKTERTLSVSGERITGYCFDEDRDVIWLEGTAQMAVALQRAEQQDRAAFLISQLEKSLTSGVGKPQYSGIPYAPTLVAVTAQGLCGSMRMNGLPYRRRFGIYSPRPNLTPLVCSPEKRSPRHIKGTTSLCLINFKNSLTLLADASCIFQIKMKNSVGFSVVLTTMVLFTVVVMSSMDFPFSWVFFITLIGQAYYSGWCTKF